MKSAVVKGDLVSGSGGVVTTERGPRELGGRCGTPSGSQPEGRAAIPGRSRGRNVSRPIGGLATLPGRSRAPARVKSSRLRGAGESKGSLNYASQECNDDKEKKKRAVRDLPFGEEEIEEKRE